MNPGALKILRRTARVGELSLKAALRIGEGKRGDHRDQYGCIHINIQPQKLTKDGYLVPVQSFDD